MGEHRVMRDGFDTIHDVTASSYKVGMDHAAQVGRAKMQSIEKSRWGNGRSPLFYKNRGLL